MRLCAAGDPLNVLIAFGGDDQALGVMKVLLESRRSGQELLATAQSSTMLANAHSSAIKVIIVHTDMNGQLGIPTQLLSIHQLRKRSVGCSVGPVCKEVRTWVAASNPDCCKTSCVVSAECVDRWQEHLVSGTRPAAAQLGRKRRAGA